MSLYLQIQSQRKSKKLAKLFTPCVLTRKTSLALSLKPWKKDNNNRRKMR